MKPLRFAIAVLVLTMGTMLRADQVTVFAAASLKTVLEELGETFEAATDHTIRMSFAGSSVLSRQIGLGAPADVFISANPEWMDVLETADHLVQGSRRVWVTNQLVVIGAQREEPLGLAKALSQGRVAMALTESVPAGIYGRTALETLNLWPQIEPRVVQADNVRAALALVAIGAAPRGIVYVTDALAEPRVARVAEFPADVHPPIRYPIAMLQDRPGVRAFYDFLLSDEARNLLTQHGFGLP